jgi:NADH:ubiquinone oxidoreductase subunit 3 (subunit A)
MLNEYFYIFIFFFISISLALIFFLISYFLILRNYDFEKTSSYECGFDPFEDYQINFDIKFYLIAILFIVFDLEISFLFPWSVSLPYIGKLGFWSMIFFLFILGIGFLYEWSKGALQWE